MYDALALVRESAEKLRIHIGADEEGPDTDVPFEIAHYWIRRYFESRGYTYYPASRSAKSPRAKLAELSWLRKWRVPSMVDPNRRAPSPKEDPLAHDPVARAARRLCIDDTLVKTPEELLKEAEREARRDEPNTANPPTSNKGLHDHLVSIAPALQTRYLFPDERRWRELWREVYRAGYLKTEYWENAKTKKGLWVFTAFRTRRSEGKYETAWSVWEKVKAPELVAEVLDEPLGHGLYKDESREVQRAIETLTWADIP